MDSRSLVRRGASELAKRSEGLALRGLQLADDLQLAETFIEEDQLASLRLRLNQVRERIGDMPEALLKGRTANPHDVQAFDVNEVLRACNHVHLRAGYVLDYVYLCDGRGGEPLVYARHVASQPLTTVRAYYDRFSIPIPEMVLGNEPTYEDSLPYVMHLQFDNSAVGFLEFALFCMTIRRFYLYWHANYNTKVFILTKARLDYHLRNRLGGLSEEQAGRLTDIDVRPRVRVCGTSAEVRLLYFGPYDIAYGYLHARVSTPNVFESAAEQELVRTGHILF